MTEPAPNGTHNLPSSRAQSANRPPDNGFRAIQPIKNGLLWTVYSALIMVLGALERELGTGRKVSCPHCHHRFRATGAQGTLSTGLVAESERSSAPEEETK
jgi:hypothetical protein